MKKIVSLLVCLSVIFLIVGVLPIHGEQEIYDSVIRLHVVANSDSEEDQELKLCVRDEIIDYVSSISSDCQSREQAQQIISENLDSIQKYASDTVTQYGYDYPVSVRLSYEEYPTKSYTSLCFPSGEYLSLQVLIGEAQGQNWWCVLFPPLCLDAASKPQSNEDAFVSVGLNPDQYKIITETKTPTYEARFKILEIIEKSSNQKRAR